MTSAELQTRLKDFAYRVMTVCEALPGKKIAGVIEDQVLRSSFSAAADYRASCKAISKKAFISKLSISFEESDGSLFWLEAIVDLNLIEEKKMVAVIEESKELAGIPAASRKISQNKLQAQS